MPAVVGTSPATTTQVNHDQGPLAPSHFSLYLSMIFAESGLAIKLLVSFAYEVASEDAARPCELRNRDTMPFGLCTQGAGGDSPPAELEVISAG